MGKILLASAILFIHSFIHLAGSHIIQAALHLSKYLGMTVNVWSSCLHLPKAGIRGMHTLRLFYVVLGSNPEFYSCYGSPL